MIKLRNDCNYLLTFRASIQFELFDPESIEKLAVIPILNPNLLDENMQAYKFGPLDNWLGIRSSMSDWDFCETCQLNMNLCPGHFGYVKLELPCFHPGYFKQTLKVLKCICKSCAWVLLNEADI